MKGQHRPRPTIPAQEDGGTTDRDFLDAMRGLEVRPLDGPPLEKPPVAKPVAGKRHRRPIRDEEVAQTIPAEEASLFLEAMNGLGMDAPRASNARVAEPTSDRDDPADTASSSPGRTPGDPVSTQEQALFFEAVANLDQIVDKDQAKPPVAASPKPERARRKPHRETPSRKASIAIDATLDLHRERQEAALERLRAFLVQCAIRRMTTVLVITGKGHHSEDGQGILRRAVEAWLIQHGAPWVARYAEAPRHLGGSGAWVLNLQR